MALKLGPSRLGPRDVLLWVLVAILGAFALGAAAVTVMVGAGKLGHPLIKTFEAAVLVATTAWWSVAITAVTTLGFAAAAVMLARRSPLTIWAWLIGFVSAAAQQGLETSQAVSAGAAFDTSGYGVLAILAVAGWGIYLVTLKPGRRRPEH